MTYCVQGGESLQMTVFEPAWRHHDTPAVVQVHGGGWVVGSRLFSLAHSPVARALVSHGLVVASIDYRMAPQFVWPAEIQDVACAVRSLRAHARMLGIDPEHIGLFGSSAGGQLVSLLGTDPDDTSWSSGPYRDESDRVQAVVDEFGPEDLTTGGWSSYMNRLVERAFGVDAGQRVGVLEQASPALHIGPGDPPFLVAQGTADRIVPPSQSEELAGRLEAAHVPTELVLVRGGGHGLGNPGEEPSAGSIDQDVVRFLITRLEPGGQHRPPRG